MEAADVARASLLGRHEVIDGLALLQPLLHLDEQLHAVHHHLHQLHLREAQAVRIGDVKDPTHGGRVHTACASLLKPQPLEHLRELLVLAQVGQLDVHPGPQPRAQVGRAGEDVAQVRVPHELVVLRLEERFNLGEAVAEAREHLLHVATLLHGDDPQMVLFVDPHQEGLVIVMPDAAGVGPVAGHARGQQQGRHGLIEKEVVVDKLLLLRLRHAFERIVPPRQVTVQARQGFDGELLDGAALPAAAVRGEAEAADAAARAHPRAQHVVGIQVVAALQVVGVEVGLVLVGGLIASVPVLNDGVKQLLEHVVRFLVAGHTAHGHDIGVAWVVHAGLDDVVHREAARGALSAQLGVQFGGQHLGHVVVVAAEVGELVFGREAQLQRVVAIGEGHGGGG